MPNTDSSSASQGVSTSPAVEPSELRGPSRWAIQFATSDSPDFARRDARQRIAFARPVAKRSQRICFGVDQVEVGEVGTQQLSERPEDAGDVGEHLVEVFVERPVALRARHEHRRDRDHA